MKNIRELVKGNVKVIEQEFVGRGIFENRLCRRFQIKKLTKNGVWREVGVFCKGKNDTIESELERAYKKYGE